MKRYCIITIEREYASGGSLVGKLVGQALGVPVYGREILEIAAEQVPRSLEDVDFAVANGNYALEAGITDKLLTTEDKDSEGAKTYANVVAVRAGDEERPEIKALVEALKSDTIRAFIEEKYGANVIPMF